MHFLWLFIMCWLSVVSSYRLPTSVTPTRYKIKILSYLEEPNNLFTFDGTVRIQVMCHQPTRNITLHSKDLTITDDQITVKKISTSFLENVKIINIEFDIDNEFLIIKLDKELKKDHKYEIFIAFGGVIEKGLEGFYRSSYVDEETNKTRWLGVTHFEATNARRAFPCFDEPAMKAVFEITLGRYQQYSSISNMPLLISEPIKGKNGWYWDKFAPTPPMSTYLIAFVISDFDYSLSKYSQNKTFRVWAKTTVRNQTNFSNEVGPKSLKYYEDFFNVEYPLPKTDMVAVPDFVSGMENWGLALFKESFMLFDPQISPLREKNLVASVIVHELAHQWVGNLVTIKWWTDLWLKEGFATYLASRAIGHLFPQWRSENEDVVSNVLNTFSFDSLNSSHPVSPEATGKPDEIFQVFDTISYDKGSLLVRMMTLFLSEDTLSNGLSNYLKKYAYQNVGQDELWESLDEEACKTGVLPTNLTVKKVMDSWTLQTGYPILTVTRDYKMNTVIITQKRYFQEQERSEDATCWWVPLTYTDGNERNFNSTRPKVWLPCPRRPLVIDVQVDGNTWILFNLKLGNPYRVNYDEKNWNLISEFLKSGNHATIPVLDKVQLIANAFDLSSTDRLKFDIWFNLLEYLQHEDEYLPWKMALDKFQYLYVQLKRTSLFADFKTYLKRRIAPIYEKLGGSRIFDDELDNLPLIKHQDNIANWACRLGLNDCVCKTQELFKKYQNNSSDITIIPKNFRTVVYCTAIRNGGETEWNFLWAQYKKSKVSSERNSILTGLGCAKKASLLRRHLDLSIQKDSGIKKEDSINVFSAIIDQEDGFQVARNFLYTRVKDIADYQLDATEYVTNLKSVITTEEGLQELENFLDENQKYFKERQSEVEKTIQTIRWNVQWRRHLKDIGKLLLKINQSDQV